MDAVLLPSVCDVLSGFTINAIPNSMYFCMATVLWTSQTALQKLLLGAINMLTLLLLLLNYFLCFFGICNADGVVSLKISFFVESLERVKASLEEGLWPFPAVHNDNVPFFASFGETDIKEQGLEAYNTIEVESSSSAVSPVEGLLLRKDYHSLQVDKALVVLISRHFCFFKETVAPSFVVDQLVEIFKSTRTLKTLEAELERFLAEVNAQLDDDAPLEQVKGCKSAVTFAKFSRSMISLYSGALRVACLTPTPEDSRDFIVSVYSCLLLKDLQEQSLFLLELTGIGLWDLLASHFDFLAQTYTVNITVAQVKKEILAFATASCHASEWTSTQYIKCFDVKL